MVEWGATCKATVRTCTIVSWSSHSHSKGLGQQVASGITCSLVCPVVCNRECCNNLHVFDKSLPKLEVNAVSFFVLGRRVRAGQNLY